MHGIKYEDAERLSHLHHGYNDIFTLFKSLLGLIIPIIMALSIKSTEFWQKSELEKKEGENTQLKSALNSLKYQLQPHFFFNSLNNIYSLVEISQEKAQESIYSLSKLMRYLLYETEKEQVDLTTELNFLEQYINLMNIRQSEDIHTEYHFPEVPKGKYSIAPLLLIPIIENAYKHGVSVSGLSNLFFELKLNDNKLFFKAINTNCPQEYNETENHGLGLANLKKRLKLIYPNKHSLNIYVKGELFYLILEIEIDKTL